MNRLQELYEARKPAPLTPMAKAAKLNGMQLAVYGPDTTDPAPSSIYAYAPGFFKRRGRMAETDPGDYLAPVIQLPQRFIPGADAA